MLQRMMHAWERKLSTRDTNRTILPFEWGFEFLNHGFIPDSDPKQSILRFNEWSKENSEEFFRHSPLREFHLSGEKLYFPSSVTSPYAQNNEVICRIFPAEKPDGRAILVLPQWNAAPDSHVALSRILSRFGFTTLRLTLPYHEDRNPSGPRADFMVSPNIGRTIQAIQQSVQDARNAADWLQSQGYTHLGIMGTSVGSCISFLTYVHDVRFRVGVFNHVSSFFADVVWNGISTQHVRRGIEGKLSREDLHRAWAAISPNSYVKKLCEDSRKRLLISARYDLTFPPDLAHLLMKEKDRWNVSYDVAYLPCGHYTSALTPFKHLDGFLICNYFRKHLRKTTEATEIRSAGVSPAEAVIRTKPLRTGRPRSH
jgi:hypothetical protein